MEHYKEFNFMDFSDNRGHLTAIEGSYDIPFEIKRIYYITGAKEGIIRGLHAHRNLQQIILCLNGSVKVKLITPTEEKIFCLDNPTKGLFIGPYTWREMYDFSDDAVLVVLASEHYNEDDYIRDLDKFMDEIKKRFLGDEHIGNTIC